MNSKLLYLSMILSVMMSVPNYISAQVKSLSDYKIIKRELSAVESASFDKVISSPSSAYRLEREKNGFSIIDNKTGFKHIPDVPGKMRFSGWSKNENRAILNLTHIPAGNGKYTGAVAIYSFNDKSTKIFKPDKYLLMNSRISPDGKMIVSTGSTKDKGYIILINIESGILTELTDIISYRPAWLPNSDQIIYVQELERNNSALVSVDLKTGNKFEIVQRTPYIDFKISPDGKYIAFTSPEGGTDIRELHMINTDGTNLVKIASNEKLGHFFPKWSPNSDMIIYERPDLTGHHRKTIASELFLYEVATNSKRQLTSESGAIHKISKWESDNSLIISSKINEKRTYSSYKLEQ